MFKYWKMAMEVARKAKEEDKLKQRLLDKEIDYAYLEHLVQKINENPLLRIRITMPNGTHIDLDCIARDKNTNKVIGAVEEDFIEVK